MPKGFPRADADLRRDSPCRSVRGPVIICTHGAHGQSTGHRRGSRRTALETKASSARGLQPGKGQVFIPGNSAGRGGCTKKPLSMEAEGWASILAFH